MRKALALILALALGIVLGILGPRVLNAQQQGIKRSVLQKVDLTGSPGKDAYVVSVEIAPGSESGKHTHPGHEFAYILDGEGVLEVAGNPPVALKPGMSVHIDPEAVHNARNTSATAPLRVLAFSVVEKGKPLTTPVP